MDSGYKRGISVGGGFGVLGSGDSEPGRTMMMVSSLKIKKDKNNLMKTCLSPY